ncbi:hypothetical protein R3P38DRAFT_3379865, partial [Favolaschia claudopus]
PRPVFHWELLPVPPELEPSATVEVDAVVLLRFTPRSAAAASAPVAGSTASPLEIDRFSIGSTTEPSLGLRRGW